MVVRPYGDRIRGRVFGLVQAAGFRIATEDVIAEGVPDAEAAARVTARGALRLVVPYHGHRSANGEALDGLSFLDHLRRLDAAFPWRVLMPVSRFGASAVESARASLDATLSSALLVVPEDELERPTLVATLAQHFASANAAGSRVGA